MRRNIDSWFQRIRQARPVLVSAIKNLVRHEWNALHGHRQAFIARVGVARQAENLNQLLRDQIDLLPESRNRFRRNLEVRRQILSTMNKSLRGSTQGRN